MKQENYTTTPTGEIYPMEKINNNHNRAIGLTLTKKNATYLLIISAIGLSFFSTTFMSAFPVLRYAITYLLPNDNLMYFYIVLLFLSNLSASSIAISISAYVHNKARTFRKSLKN